MSLFPAAAASSASVSDKKSKESNNWLQNSSYRSDRASDLIKLENKLIKHEFSSDTSEDEIKHTTKRNSDKKSRKRKHHSPTPAFKKTKEIKEEKTSKLVSVDDGKACVIVDRLESDMPKFLTDKNADMDNVHFGRLYKVLRPKYYQDFVYCIGTPAWQYLQVNKSSKKKKRKKRNTDNVYRYFNNELIKNVSVFQVKQQRDMNMSFTENYIRIFDKESDDENIEQSQNVNESEDVSKKTTEELNKNTRENPQDIETWLKLLSWQDTLLKDSVVLGRSRILTEKKIEILNHAIKANPKNAKLQLMKIRLTSELISDTAVLDQEWQNLLFRFPDNIEVWEDYILHINCNSFTAFSLKRTRRAFAHCIEILRSIKQGKYKQDVSTDISVEQRLVQVFTEYTHFLFSTGHTEQCVALYQCVLEINFRGSPSTTHWSEITDYLQQYFTSKEARLGEKGSKGFNTWITKHEAGGWIAQTVDPVDEEEEEVDVDPDESLTQNWLKIEICRSERDWLPWRPSSESIECDDEERKVLFSEIRDLMFIVDKKNSKILLLRHFLYLFGSPMHCSTSTSEPFANQNIFFFTDHRQVLKPIDKLLELKPLLLGYCQGTNLGVLNTSKHVFLGDLFSQLLQCCDDKIMKAMLCFEYMAYYENRAIGLFLNGKTKNLKRCGKEARKIAKKLLGVNPDLLHIWCSFGVTEWLSGKRSEACKIFQTTLSMSMKSSQTLDREARTKLCSQIHFLCRTFSQLHFTMCDLCLQSTDKSTGCVMKSAVLYILAALADGYKFTEYIEKLSQSNSLLRPTSVMKAISGFARLTEELQSLYEQYEFEKTENDSLEYESLSSYFDVVCCQYIFTVCSRSSNSDDIVENAVLFLRKKLCSGSSQAKLDLEHLHLMRLFSLRTNVNGYNRSKHRKAIYEAANEFPCNPYFAQMLGDIDMPSYLCGNVRRFFTRICSENVSSVIPWLCATNFELKRRRKFLEFTASSEVTSTESKTLLDARIHNLFEHALAVGTNMGSLVLWRAYLAAEAEMDQSKVYGLYTRAVNSCSWSRDLHMDILSSQPHMLNEVVNNMSKKGLRLRTPVEEIQLLMTI